MYSTRTILQGNFTSFVHGLRLGWGQRHETGGSTIVVDRKYYNWLTANIPSENKHD